MNVKTFLDQQTSNLLSIKQTARDNFGDLTDHQLNWKPAPEKWSISQNLEHLNITTTLYLDEIREAIKAGKNKDVAGRDFQYSWLGKWFVQLMKPQSRFRFKAFKVIKPGEEAKGKQSLEEFLSLQDEIYNFLIEAYNVDIKAMRVQSPVFPMLKLRLGEAFEAVINHEQRHLMQANGVIKTLEFPLAKAVNHE